jgi:micrococcal nuclease
MRRARKYIYGSVGVIFLLVFIFSFQAGRKNDGILGAWDTMPLSATPTIPSFPTNEIARPISPAQSGYPVTKVIDGDTIVVAIGGVNQTIRLIGVNTPESVDPRRPVECFGNEASARAKSLLLGHTIRLIADPTQGDKDKYNRLLRYVYREDGLFVNKQLIEDGYASEYTYATPYQYQSDFRQAQIVAQREKRGLWSPQAACAGYDQNILLQDKDCKDFLTQKEAQDFFTSFGGPAKDPHKLDSNGDGTVCESLP